MRSALIVIALFAITSNATAQDEPRRGPATKKDGPWFGVMLPPKTDAAAVKVGLRPARPASGFDNSSPEFAGTAIKNDVATIVGFARAAGQAKEIGNGQMWGRISGFPSSEKTIEWAADQFRKAGMTDVHAH